MNRIGAGSVRVLDVGGWFLCCGSIIGRIESSNEWFLLLVYEMGSRSVLPRTCELPYANWCLLPLLSSGIDGNRLVAEVGCEMVVWGVWFKRSRSV
jgi:hypothetical protein